MTVRVAPCSLAIALSALIPSTTQAAAPIQSQGSPPAPVSSPSATVETQVAHMAAVKELVHLINVDRRRHGLNKLRLSVAQSGCSLQHTEHMARQGLLSHDQFPQDVCAQHRVAGENAGYWTGEPSLAVRAIHQSMMAEGPCPAPCTPTAFIHHDHYINLLNPLFRRVGIGIVVQQGVTWVTEDFTG